jgi:hypothetical protein
LSVGACSGGTALHSRRGATSFVGDQDMRCGELRDDDQFSPA